MRSSSASSAGKGGPGRPTWFATHGRDLRFLGLFGLFLLGFYLMTLIPYARQDVFPGYLRLNAVVSAAILNGFGEGVEARQHSLIGRRFALTIERGCDAVEPAALFCSAVLASPVALSARFAAVVVGTTLLMVLNLLRILSLYYVGVYYRKAFDIVHLDVWQALFIILALFLWAIWASWATRKRTARSDAST